MSNQPPAQEPRKFPGIRVCFLLAPSFTILPFAGFIDSLRHAVAIKASGRPDHHTWTIVTGDGNPVTSSCGVPIAPNREIDLDEHFDYVVVVGGLLPETLDVGDQALDFLRANRARGTMLVGLCIGSFVIAKAGLLDGHRACVHLTHKPDMEQLFPRVRPLTDETFVLDNNILTCPGGTAAIDVAIEIIARHYGKARAMMGLHHMVVDAHRAAHHLPTRSYDLLANCGNRHVERAIKLMEMNIAEHRPIKDLAAELGISESQLDRTFVEHTGMTPLKFWRKIRLENAHWMICNTHHSITIIAHECGFFDSTHLGKRFKAVHGDTPMAIRKRNKVDFNIDHNETAPAD